jgi:hypothetical protein
VPHLSEANLHELAAARAAGRKVRRAISIANFDGWTLGALGALTFVFSLTDLPGLMLGVGMMGIAVIELRGAGRLRHLEPSAARTLGFNQLALGTLLFAYALWRIISVATGKGVYDAVGASDPQLAHMLQPVENLTRLVSFAVYAALMAIAVFAQGGLALFYFSRVKHVQEYVARTPAWIIAMQRAGISI